MSFYSKDVTPGDVVEPEDGLVLPYPVLHPALRQACADALGWTREDVDALIDDPDCELWVDPGEPMTLKREGGPLDARFGIRGITLALEAARPELLLRRLPIPGKAERLAPWLRIVSTVRSHERYLELNAPDSVLVGTAYSLQEALDALVRLPEPAEGSRWVTDETREVELRLANDEEWAEREEALQRILRDHSRLLWIDDERICVCDEGRTRVVSSVDGSVLAELEIHRGLAPMGCGGGHAVFFDPRHPPTYDAEGYYGIAAQVLDLTSLAFVDTYPADLPLVVLEHGEPEDAMLVDLRTGWTLTLEPQDRTYHQAFSRGLDLVWIGDFLQEIFDVREGRRLYFGRDHDFLDDAQPPVWLDPDGGVVKDADPEDFNPEDTGGPMAIHRTGDTLLQAWMSVGPIGAPVFGFAFHPRALGFSPDGSRIAALTETGISIFDTAAARLVRQVRTQPG